MVFQLIITNNYYYQIYQVITTSKRISRKIETNATDQIWCDWLLKEVSVQRYLGMSHIQLDINQKMPFQINQVHTTCLYLSVLIVRILVWLTISGSQTFFHGAGIFFFYRRNNYLWILHEEAQSVCQGEMLSVFKDSNSIRKKSLKTRRGEKRMWWESWWSFWLPMLVPLWFIKCMCVI